MSCNRGSARVVIVGGGLAGVETALYLRERLGQRADVTLISTEDRFIFRPFLTYVPFGLTPEKIQLDLALIARVHDFKLMIGRVDDIRLDRKLVRFGAPSVTYVRKAIGTRRRCANRPS